MPRPAAIPAFALAAALLLPAGGQAQNALDRSPQPGDRHVTNGYCLAPEVHDRLIETLLNDGEHAAMRAYGEAKTMGACRSRRVQATYLKRTYRFPWPGRPAFAGEQWLIRLNDSDKTAHILIMVRDAEG